MKTARTSPRNVDAFPVYAMYASMPSKKISSEEARHADFETRLRSIGRFIAGQAARFWFSLSREGRISYDLDDICNEIWIELQTKNNRYEPDKGSYLLFAGRLIRNKLIDLREHSRCVRVPEGSSSTFAEYQAADEVGLTTAAQTETVAKVLAAGRDHVPVYSRYGYDDAEPVDESDTPLEELDRQETETIQMSVLAERLCTLTTMESVVLGASMGLWGQDKTPMSEVASNYGKDEKYVCRELRSARKKLGIPARL